MMTENHGTRQGAGLRRTLWIVLPLLVLGALRPAAEGQEPVFPFSGLETTPEALNRGLTEKDLAFHPLSGSVYNEQKFFLVQCDSGHMILIGMYVVKAGPIHKYGISLTVILPDLERIFVKHLFDRDAFRFSTETCSLEAGKDVLKGRHPDYVLHIEDEKATVSLDIHDLAPGWRPGSGRVTFGESRKKFYDFVMAHSRAAVTGSLCLEEGRTCVPLKGMLYADHCYVNLLPTEQAVNWYSLRAFGKELSVNYIEFVTPEKYGSRRIPWLQVADDQAVLWGTLNVDQKLSGYTADPASGDRYPTVMELSVADPGFRLAAKVQVQSLLERFDVFSDLNPALRLVAKAFFHRPIIFRFKSRYDISVRMDPAAGRRALDHAFTGTGMSEVLFVR